MSLPSPPIPVNEKKSGRVDTTSLGGIMGLRTVTLCHNNPNPIERSIAMGVAKRQRNVKVKVEENVVKSAVTNANAVCEALPDAVTAITKAVEQYDVFPQKGLELFDVLKTTEDEVKKSKEKLDKTAKKHYENNGVFEAGNFIATVSIIERRNVSWKQTAIEQWKRNQQLQSQVEARDTLLKRFKKLLNDCEFDEETQSDIDKLVTSIDKVDQLAESPDTDEDTFVEQEQEKAPKSESKTFKVLTEDE